MNKREGFLRQLTRELPAGELVPALETLLAEGLEVYCRKRGGVSRLLSSAEELSAAGELSSNEELSAAGDEAPLALYVAAADVEFARKRLAEEGHGGLLCPYQPPREPEDELEKARKAYLRRRKSMYIQCGLILALIVIYLVIRTYTG